MGQASQPSLNRWYYELQRQKDIQRDICTMDADSFVSMSYYMLTCFDEKSDDDVRDAAKKYLPYYAPENNTEKLDGTRVKTALFDMLRSADA